MLKWPLARVKTMALAQVAGLFAFCYLGTNYLTTFRQGLYHFYFDWELDIAIMPWMILPYCSVYISPLVVLWYASDREIQIVRRSLSVQILISTAIYLAFPAHLGYTRQVIPGIWETWYKVLHTIDYPHNLLPSLHVAFALAWVLALRSHIKLWAQILLWIWLALVCASIVLTHQHHILDGVSGLLLGLMCYLWARRSFEKAA